MNLIHSITLPDYPIQYQQSAKQRATHFKFKELNDDVWKKIPKKHHLNGIIISVLDKKGKAWFVLVDSVTSKPIVKNEAKVGTPRVKPIMGQDLFNLQGQSHNHTKILNTIKEWFFSHWTIHDRLNISTVSENEKDLIVNYPLVFRFIYRNPNGPDIDNHRIFYEKAIIDCLKVFIYTRKTNKDKLEKVFNPVGFLPDDRGKYLARIVSEWQQFETRELVLEIYQK